MYFPQHKYRIQNTEHTTGVIMGDMNADLLKFESHNTTVTNWGVRHGPISHNNEQTQSVEGII